jgi:hypothetical protein
MTWGEGGSQNHGVVEHRQFYKYKTFESFQDVLTNKPLRWRPVSVSRRSIQNNNFACGLHVIWFAFCRLLWNFSNDQFRQDKRTNDAFMEQHLRPWLRNVLEPFQRSD